LEEKGNREGIGMADSTSQTFFNHEFTYAAGDLVILFSDGVVDQFGGPNGKKLKRSGLVKWIAERERTAVDMQRFSDYFDTFAEGQMIVDDALMLILSTG
jgi:serine phosphatase RsbU (regulator of sigma subunit)